MWTPEKVRELVTSGRAKVEPFNNGFAKLSMRRPAPDLTTIKEPLNRFFAEGAPIYSGGTLVPAEIVREAFSGDHMPSFGHLMRLAAAVGTAKKSGDALAIEQAESAHEEYRLLCQVADGMHTPYTKDDLDRPAPAPAPGA